MLIARRIKLITPLLAAKPSRRDDLATRDPIRVFRKKTTGNGVQIESDIARWNWAFLTARDALSDTIDTHDMSVASIMPFPSYEVGKTSIYRRTYRRDGKQLLELFESLPAGQTIDWKFTLAANPPPHEEDSRFTRSPSQEEFDLMLEYIGEHIGMSEWGHVFQYGRFKVCEPSKNNTHNVNQPNPGNATAGVEADDLHDHGTSGSHIHVPGDGDRKASTDV